MMYLLEAEGTLTFESYMDELAIDYMKEEVCIVYETLFGDLITLGDVRFVGPELLFQPSLFGLEGPGLTEAIIEALNKCNESHHEELLGNIVLGGGNTLFMGLEE